MDPTTLRSYINDAQYRLQQAEERLFRYQQEAQTYDQQAAGYDEQAQQHRRYADDARSNASSYINDQYNAQRDIEYYTNQLIQAEQVAIQNARY